MAVDARAPKQVPADGEVAATAAAAAAEKSARKQPPTNQRTLANNYRRQTEPNIRHC